MARKRAASSPRERPRSEDALRNGVWSIRNREATEWLKTPDKERINSDWKRVLRDMLDEDKTGCMSASGVVRRHLEAVEAGQISLREAFLAVNRFDGTAWRFEPGDVVEWRGGDTRWRLGFVVSSVRGKRHAIFSPEGLQITSDNETDLDAPRPRPSSKVIRALFGPAPFQWQQHALLDAERTMVHRLDSPFDFQKIEWTSWAEERWDRWIHENSGHEGPGARAALKSIILEPFVLIDQINSSWNIDDLSVYTYFSCLGCGATMAFVCLAVQFGAMVVLWRYSIVRVGVPAEYREGVDSGSTCRPPGGVSPLLRKILICVVALHHLVKVLINTLSSTVTTTARRHTGFLPAAGRASVTGKQRLIALRRNLRSNDVDSIEMMIGLRIHDTMRTAFVAVLCLLNLNILSDIDSVEGILFNWVAVEWIRCIDESLCFASWWDPNQRFIKAAAVEMIIRQFVNATALEKRWQELRAQGKHPREGESTYSQEHERVNEAACLNASKDFPELKTFLAEELDGKLRREELSSSVFLGRFKSIVFGRWGRFLDNTIDWTAETHSTNSCRMHGQRRETDDEKIGRDSIHLTYGDEQWYPSAYFGPGFQQACGESLRNSPESRKIATSFLRLKSLREVFTRGSSAEVELLHHTSANSLRRFANRLDSIVGVGAFVIVISCCTVIGLFYVRIT